MVMKYILHRSRTAIWKKGKSKRWLRKFASMCVNGNNLVVKMQFHNYSILYFYAMFFTMLFVY